MVVNGQDESILPGIKPVLELLESDPGKIDCVFVRKGRGGSATDRILDLCREKGVRFILASQEAFPRMAPGTGHQGVAARLAGTSFTAWEDLLTQAPYAPLPLIVALDQVLDPGNVGTLVRTLYALGAAGLVVPKHNSAFLGPGARRSAAGALEKLPIAQVTNLARAVEQARKDGYRIFAAQKVEDSMDPFRTNLPMPAVLVLGSEEKGIRPGVLKHCDGSLCIPFRRDFDSLNVAQAGAILASCFARSV